VQGEIKEQWTRLCEMAAAEQDSEKLSAIVKEINRLLEEKEQRLSKFYAATLNCSSLAVSSAIRSRRFSKALLCSSVMPMKTAFSNASFC